MSSSRDTSGISMRTRYSLIYTPAFSARSIRRRANACYKPSLVVSLRANLYVGRNFRAVLLLENQIILAQESRASLPVENATLYALSASQRVILALDYFSAP